MDAHIRWVFSLLLIAVSSSDGLFPSTARRTKPPSVEIPSLFRALESTLLLLPPCHPVPLYWSLALTRLKLRGARTVTNKIRMHLHIRKIYNGFAYSDILLIYLCLYEPAIGTFSKPPEIWMLPGRRFVCIGSPAIGASPLQSSSSSFVWVYIVVITVATRWFNLFIHFLFSLAWSMLTRGSTVCMLCSPRPRFPVWHTPDLSSHNLWLNLLQSLHLRCNDIWRS